MYRWLLSITAIVQFSLALAAQADPLSAGPRFADMFFKGNLRAIWDASTPDMKRAFRSVDELAAIRTELLTNFGAEKVILSEQTNKLHDLHIFTRIARWTDAQYPLEIVIAIDDAEQIAGFFIRPQSVAAPSRNLEYDTKASLRLPVNGEWFVYWGGRTVADNYHAVDVGQRFAIDLLILHNGQSYYGDPVVLENYYCWGLPIFAPGDGVVAGTVDGLPDQAIGTSDPKNPAGNHVVIDFGNKEFGFLAHLRRNSLSVKAGEHVKVGQEIGLCGNSGNSSEPHLHFHLQTSPELGQGEGLPALFVNYLANGVLID